MPLSRAPAQRRVRLRKRPGQLRKQRQRVHSSCAGGGCDYVRARARVLGRSGPARAGHAGRTQQTARLGKATASPRSPAIGREPPCRRSSARGASEAGQAMHAGNAPRVLLARRAGTSAPRAIESQRHVSLASSARHIGSSELTRLCAAAGRRRTVRTAVVHRARSMRGSKIEARHLVVGSDPWQHPSRLGSPTLSAAAHVADTRDEGSARRNMPAASRTCGNVVRPRALPRLL